ncbi:uncharacterized protein LOC113847752 [Abrus precatorius]|uniref:Uncharacterized protein LOC113847752 n=1 Tax=Abrus precatorius TaxID=3816 RepID=A0A8B8JNH5_ABRPR|nr:uncharacterized protein LOC113847752 [Abrus precatorius]XP_027332819.1 uncharacterized protein LOC113847752 [Abrus precatorius]
MGHTLIKINPGDSQRSEHRKGQNSDEDNRRLERRWRRWELSNDRLKHNHCGSATKSNVKGFGNMAILTGKNGLVSEDEIDEDYKMFLDTYISDIDVVTDVNVDGSDFDISAGYNSNNDDDCDPHYKTFLENLREEGGSHLYSCSAENKSVHKRYGGQDKERLHNELKLDTMMLRGLKLKDEIGNLKNKVSDLMRKQTGGPMESRKNLETERGPCKKRPCQDFSKAPKSIYHSNVGLDDVDEDYQIFLNSCRIEDDGMVYMDSELMGKSSTVRQNSQVSNHLSGAPETLNEIDDDYQQFLNSIEIVDDDWVFMPERDTSKTDSVDGGSNSSDPDLILLEPNQIYENTPFVSSKTYDASWFENKMNHGDSWQFSAYDHSQFRRRLMQDLLRPYDQEECDRLLHEVHQKRQKERHVETRRGVVKSYRAKGVNKSYLELYPDLAKAITGFKEPERVLFLLRGFIFWLQNLTHEGIFQPWLDKSCLDILRKM